MAEMTGRKVFLITAGFFGVIITVNLVMATQAVTTFPGLEVKNSYVASQSFDDERTAQVALGWQLATDYSPAAKELRLTFTDAEGLPAPLSDLQVLIGRTTEAREDSRPEFRHDAGAYVTPIALGQGKWMLHVEARAEDGTLFRKRVDLYVKG